MRIQYIVKNYPQLSQTYIKSELHALLGDFEINIVATSIPNTPDTESLPYTQISETENIIREIEKFKPDVIHSHYLVLAEKVSEISKATGIPFTLRAHSFDAIRNGRNGAVPRHIEHLSTHLNHDLCKGVLIFPFTRLLLEKEGGIKPEKLIDSVPVVDVARFTNTGPNGSAIMNTGACIPKKEMETFVKLSKLLPHETFNLYALGHKIDSIRQLNDEVGGRVNFMKPVPYSKMPGEYKKHKSMVYTAHMGLKTVGWPMAVIEAMASGTIVYMPNIRPDIKDFVGEAGFLYEQIEEVAEHLQGPVDLEKRNFAFEHAKKFDIAKQIQNLTSLWSEV